jgi:acetyl coenzyme A synthetase (ADP forming)-like protein
VNPIPSSRLWDVVLRDGSTIHIRPARREDQPAIRTFLGGLSPDSLRLRFFSGTSPDAFDYSMVASDEPARRLTLVAESLGRVVGMATYVRSAERGRDAEAAFVVADALQGRGLGTRLLELLGEVARGHDIETFTAHVLPGNDRMLEVFRDSGFPTTIKLAHGECVVSVELRLSATGDDLAIARSRTAAAASMRRVFEPRSIAVIGAGRSRGTIGAEIFHNLRERFRGRVIPINPKASAIDGVSAYPSVRKAPGPVDLAVVAVPAADVPGVVDDCIASGVKGLVVITAGFAETGADGRRRQDELLGRVREAGIRMIGPNCMGILNTDPAIGMNATFSPVYPPEGRIAMATQSGALGLAILDYARELGVGISSFASIGNKADVSSNDLIQYWAEDPRTHVILLYLESFGNPRTFRRLARHVGRSKPIVTIKAGRSAAGQRAAGSHTGALASSDLIVDALFRQAGIVRVNTLEEMFDVATFLAGQPMPKGPRLGIVTNAGGGGILAADMAEAQGLVVPPLTQQTMESLRAILPAAASVGNPVDLLASASASQYEQALSLMLADPQVDSVLAIFVPPLITDPSQVAAAIARAAGKADKPVGTVFMRAAGAPVELGSIPCYRFPESAALAVARATVYGQWRERPTGPIAPVTALDTRRIDSIVEAALRNGGGWMPPDQAQDLLIACGIPVPETRVVTSVPDAADAADGLGFPVVLKVVGPALVHKTEVGGVRLDLRDRQAVLDAAGELEARLGEKLTGFSVQRMAAEGVELLVGLVADESFGPVVLCSLGGTTVEVLGRPAARLTPLSEIDIEDLLADMPGRALLGEFRGRAAIDDRPVRDLLRRVSALAERHASILEMDLNPVRLSAGSLLVLDVRIRVGHSAPTSRGRRISY